MLIQYIYIYSDICYKKEKTVHFFFVNLLLDFIVSQTPNIPTQDIV